MEAVKASRGFFTLRFSRMEHLSQTYSSPLRNGFQCTLASYNRNTKTRWAIITVTGQLYCNHFCDCNSILKMVEGSLILFMDTDKQKHVNSGGTFWLGVALKMLPAMFVLLCVENTWMARFIWKSLRVHLSSRHYFCTYKPCLANTSQSKQTSSFNSSRALNSFSCCLSQHSRKPWKYGKKKLGNIYM